jgi:hypothetical protein
MGTLLLGNRVTGALEGTAGGLVSIETGDIGPPGTLVGTSLGTPLGCSLGKSLGTLLG